ncbi:MAG: twin-arginine translocase TatA/TatE family subunit, partial [Stenotrophomonas maltophilia]
IVLVVILLFVFGAKRLPEIGSSLGKGLRTFKSAVTGEDEKREQSQPERKDSSPSNNDDLV